MEFSSKKLERYSKLVNFLVSVSLATFLILLSNNIINDLQFSTTQPTIEDFQNMENQNRLQRESSQYQLEIESLYNKQESIRKTIDSLSRRRILEKESFDNWLRTRTSIGSPKNDSEVLSRTKKLDETYAIENEWISEKEKIQSEIDALYKKQRKIQDDLSAESREAYQKLDKEINWFNLKIFLFRLLFVGPILALGVFFFIRFRKHKFSPIFQGFSLFSLYAFFFGLVPYLPSYGGYIRYGVGTLLTIGIGVYVIKKIQEYVEKKKQELASSSETRAKQIEFDLAEKALEKHYCPSCGKDFILRDWEISSKKTDMKLENQQFFTDYCRHCGLNLFKNCVQCGVKNFSLLPYCSSCGVSNKR